MPVSKTFHRLVEEALRPWVAGLRFRNMFGGVGIYQGSLFFALLAEDQLYFKVDDSNRPSFEAIGSQPFRPFGHAGPVMQYYEVPLDMLETPGRIQLWVEQALAVAHRALEKKSKSPRSPRKKAKTVSRQVPAASSRKAPRKKKSVPKKKSR